MSIQSEQIWEEQKNCGEGMTRKIVRSPFSENVRGRKTL